MRRRFVSLVGPALCGLAGSALSQVAASASAPLDCGTGPVTKPFGGVPWLVYGCSDQRSVVLMSAPGSPAMPFYFMFSASGSAHRLIGEGTGNKAATDRAYEELKLLSEAQIRQLFGQAKSAARPK
jgi:hypothetical protein